MFSHLCEAHVIGLSTSSHLKFILIQT